VEDDGIGFAASHAARKPQDGHGYGLHGVCERLALVDGGLTLEDLRPGARVRLTIPIISGKSRDLLGNAQILNFPVV
jgi:signal transduction histidine kinase